MLNSDSKPNRTAQVSLNEVVINSELERRSARKPDYQIEALALVELAATLARSPNEILQKLADFALKLCGADSAGISIAEVENDVEIFRWRAVAGQLSPFLGGTMPRNFSPCGVVVDSRTHQLMKNLDGHFQYCSQLGLALPEVLLVPFSLSDVPLGTLWAVAHGPEKKFDAEDLRILKSLSSFAAAAFQSLQNLERERANYEALATERSKLETIVDRSPAGIALFRGPDSIFEKFNYEWTKLVSEREYLEKTYAEVYPELADTKLPGILKAVYETGEPFTAYEMKIRVTGRSGNLEDRYYDFSYIRILGGDEKPYGIFCHANDVTDRVQNRHKIEESENRLLQSEERLKKAIEVSKVGFYDWDMIKDQVSFSEQMKTDWQMESGGNLQSALDRIHPGDRDRVLQQIQDSINNREWYKTEYRVVRPDGSEIGVEVHGEVSYSAEGTPVRFLGTSLDITERNKIRELIESAKSEAESANQTKSAFLANMSHEMRTPLGVIIGFSEIALQKGQTESEKQDAFERIHRNAMHLATLTNDILDLAKVEADKFDPEIIDFATNNFFSDIIESASVKAREKGLKFIFQQEDVLPKVLKTDPTRLKQILMNIIGNAIKFTESGEIHLNITTITGGGPNSLMLQFLIQDSGVGLTSKQMEGLFEPFKQGDNSTTRKYGGTGLGLMLSRKFARSLGGDVKLLSSTPGKGSQFQVLIESAVSPAAHAENGRFGNPASSDTEALQGLKVLVVEDSLDNQDLIGRYLRFAGAAVEFRDNGRDGFTAAMSSHYDVVLMDVQMPIMEGYEAVGKLRDSDYKKPVIALTAHAMRGERERSMAAGFSEYLVKPIDRGAMIAMIQKFGRNL